MDLDHDFSAGHCVVMHVRIEKRKASCWESSHLALIKGISHTNLESTGDNRDVFPLRMPMRRDALSVGHLQTHGVIPARCAGVALQHGKLRAGGYKCGWRTVRNAIWHECMSLRRSGLCANRNSQARTAQESENRNLNMYLPSHVSTSLVELYFMRIFLQRIPVIN